MMPNPFALVSRVDKHLKADALIGVCDFYVSASEESPVSKVVGDIATRQCSWFARTFWRIWCAACLYSLLHRSRLPKQV